MRGDANGDAAGLAPDWKARLRAAPGRAAARADRDLFRALNPALDYPPILKAKPRRYRPASVLIGVLDRPEPAVLMTVRTADMPSHAGQIGLPGGGPRDGEDAVAAALREAHEEVGLTADQIEVVGTMGRHFGGQGWAVTPVLGIVAGDARPVPCPREVDAVFEVPLAYLTDRTRHLIEPRTFAGVTFDMYAVPYTEAGGRNWHVWGLTAGILETFCRAYNDHPLPEGEVAPDYAVAPPRGGPDDVAAT